MYSLTIICISLVLLAIACYSTLFLYFFYGHQANYRLATGSSSVSVIIAMRNEAENIKNLATCLEGLIYPTSKLEILVGDDDSDDNSVELARDYMGNNVTLVNPNGSSLSSGGKMSVLEHLTDVSQGESLLFTDADMHLNRNWVQGMANGAQENVGMVIGYTGVKAAGIFGHIQNIDWCLAQGVIKLLNDRGHPIAAWGNNMMVKRDVFDAVQGYQGMSFSIIEDVALMRRIVGSGYQLQFRFNPKTYGQTNPATSLGMLLNQRRRWMLNLANVPLWLRVNLFAWMLYPIAMIVIFVSFPVLAIILFLLKFLIAYLSVNSIMACVEKKSSMIYVLLYEIFGPFIYISTLINSLFQRSIIWKERRY